VTRALKLIAPAKINWTLDVLRIRPDGYHEIRSILQTLDLHDTVTLHPAPEIELELSGDPSHLVDEPPAENLAYRAAEALRRHADVAFGARIELNKQIPLAAGLGGGSSDAAATLRGCNVLWNLRLDDAELAHVAAKIGSDVPFFIRGGTAMVSGRGDIVEVLRDGTAPQIILAAPPVAERGPKTAMMYRALAPHDFTEGEATMALRQAIDAGHAIDDAEIANAFERVLSGTQPHTERAMVALREQGYSPHLAGSGPSFFLLAAASSDVNVLEEPIRHLGFEPLVTHALPRSDANHIEEL
jgi:4-diphosphocytidyl-2-C-methyl-D-erythritol kinase